MQTDIARDGREAPLLYSVQGAHELLGKRVGRDALYDLIRTGQIGTVAIGRKRLIPRGEIDAWIARATERAPTDEALDDEESEGD